MSIGIIHSIWTVLIFISFIGIVFWAYSSKQKDRFYEAENLVFDDEQNNTATLNKGAIK